MGNKYRPRSELSPRAPFDSQITPSDKVDFKEVLKKILGAVAHKRAKLAPRQENGYDCGVFVTRYAQMVLDAMPILATSENIKQGFSEMFNRQCFNQDDITEERNKLRTLLKR